ncbi:MAG: BCCT family transporter [Gammaproteobacteria bacterium]|nr:BCCT family transporter [Gammaproteobacteria bacterium]
MNLPWSSAGYWTEACQDSLAGPRGATVFDSGLEPIPWAPYVGIFIARISRGRTIRQFVTGALGAPTLFTVLWFAAFGLAAVDQELDQRRRDLGPSRSRQDVPVGACSFPSWNSTRWRP